MTFWYLATPYSKFPLGPGAAFREAAHQHAILLRHRIPVFCPIVHTHPPASVGHGLDPLDGEFWKDADAPFLRACCGVIVCKLASWQHSLGMAHEIEFAGNSGKPIVYMEPGVVPGYFIERGYGP